MNDRQDVEEVVLHSSHSGKEGGTNRDDDKMTSTDRHTPPCREVCSANHILGRSVDLFVKNGLHFGAKMLASMPVRFCVVVFTLIGCAIDCLRHASALNCDRNLTIQVSAL